MRCVGWFIGALIAACLAVAACDRPQSDSQEAVKANTVPALQEPSKDHPKSAHDGEAEPDIETATAWANAEKTGTPDGFFAFAQKYPESSLVSKAMETGKKLLFEREPAIAKDFNPSGMNSKGSISVVATSPSASSVLLRTERAGDFLAMAASLSGLGNPQFGIGTGSEIRLGGSGSQWTVPQGERLCLRRDSAGWVFLCGSGVLKTGTSGDQVVGRSFQTCLFLCDHPNEYVREGVGRDLGRLSLGRSAADREKALAALNRLLDDPSEDVRMGALEGLGCLGSPEALASLRNYAKKKGIDPGKLKKDNKRNDRAALSDALGTIGGYRIIGVPELNDAISLAEAGQFFANAHEWVLSCPVWARVSANRSAAEKALDESKKQGNPKVREAAQKIAKECRPASEAKPSTKTTPAGK
jgi:hypothetical protein